MVQTERWQYNIHTTLVLLFNCFKDFFFNAPSYLSNPCTHLGSPRVFQEVEAPRFQDSLHIKAVGLSAQRNGRIYPPGYIPGTHFCQRLNRAQCHSVAGRIMPKKSSSDNIGNRNSDLPACSAASQPLRATLLYFRPLIFGLKLFVWLYFITLPCTYSIISLGNIIFECRPLFSETLQGRIGRT